MQLDRCPSYSSKSQEERECPELLERNRRRVPRALTGVTKGASLSFSSSSSLSSLFCRLSQWQSSQRHRLPPRLVLQSRFQETSSLKLLRRWYCPPAATSLSSVLFLPENISLITVEIITFSFHCYLVFFTSPLESLQLCVCPKPISEIGFELRKVTIQ